ncbi:MAG: hypothetical protein U0169_20105 [Polyangiaceae bacterium]
MPSPIPVAKTDDAEDVAWALQTAEAMWSGGDHGEALKWLRRAAEAASEAEADDRALELAKAAADLAQKIAPTPPPPSVAPSSTRGSIAATRRSAGPAPAFPMPTPSPSVVSSAPPGANSDAARLARPPVAGVAVGRPGSARPLAPATPPPPKTADSGRPQPSRGIAPSKWRTLKSADGLPATPEPPEAKSASTSAPPESVSSRPKPPSSRPLEREESSEPTEADGRFVPTGISADATSEVPVPYTREWREPPPSSRKHTRADAAPMHAPNTLSNNPDDWPTQAFSGEELPTLGADPSTQTKVAEADDVSRSRNDAGDDDGDAAKSVVFLTTEPRSPDDGAPASSPASGPSSVRAAAAKGSSDDPPPASVDGTRRVDAPPPTKDALDADDGDDDEGPLTLMRTPIVHVSAMPAPTQAVRVFLVRGPHGVRVVPATGDVPEGAVEATLVAADASMDFATWFGAKNIGDRRNAK